jgi:hypothetical protein
MPHAKDNKTRIVSAISQDPKYIQALKTKIENQVEAAVTNMILNPREWKGGWARTLRRNGEVIDGSFRNIFDLGQLFISIEYKWRGMSLHIVSNCPYIEAVLYGTNQYPGRNFLDLKGVKLG